MVVGVASAGLGLKAALGALIKAVGTKAAGKAAATSVIRPALQNVGRAAGQRMLQAGLTKGELARSAGMDALMSVPFTLMSPGSPDEKVMQLGLDTMLGFGPGVAGRFALGKRAFNPVTRAPTFVGQGVDYLGYGLGYPIGQPLIGDPLQRGLDRIKGGRGETPYEEDNRKYYEQLLAQLQQKYPGMTMQDLMGMG